MENTNAYEFKILSSVAEGEIEVKKSRFLAAVAPCKTEDEARAFIESIKKKHFDARHNCFAMRIGRPKGPMDKFSDDGEPQGTAGKPMLDILRGSGLYDICAVVTRYFGGTLLGTGGLVRAYSDALKTALSNADSSGLVIKLSKGRIVSVSSDYSFINKIKFYAERKSLHPYKEVYLEKCELSYVVPENEAADFVRSVTDMSGGRAEPDLGDIVLYGFNENKEIVIY